MDSTLDPHNRRATAAGPRGISLVAAALHRAGVLAPRSAAQSMYHVNDQLHSGREVCVAADKVADVVSSWLAELGAESPMVEQLSSALAAGQLAVAHDIAAYLSVDVAVAAG